VRGQRRRRRRRMKENEKRRMREKRMNGQSTRYVKTLSKGRSFDFVRVCKEGNEVVKK
jgi:hypothetical protein